jgi:hypothetical protein
MSDTFGFYGEDLTFDDCELLAFAKVAHRYRESEAALFGLKWFDYRWWHPVKCTYYYAHCYERAVRDAYAKTKDKNTAASVEAFASPNVFELPSEVVGLWRARQGCDLMGVRYDFALRFAFNRFSDRGWMIFPRPNQLYGQEFLLDLRDAWAEECRHTLQMVAHPFYKTRYFNGHPNQVAYRDWLIVQAKRRDQPHRVLSRMLEANLIHSDFAGHALGLDTLKRALALLPKGFE